MTDKSHASGAFAQLLQSVRERIHEVPGDPFNGVLDQLKTYAESLAEGADAFAEANPNVIAHLNQRELSDSDLASFVRRSYLAIIGYQFRQTIADRLKEPALKSPAMLSVSVVDHWDINADVGLSPPYDVRLSLNLWQFLSTMSNLFLSGIGIDIKGDDGASITTVESPRSAQEIGRDVRRVLDVFIANQTISDIQGSLPAAHYSMHHIMFFSAMAFVIGHEFGHVVIRFSQRTGKTPPFEDFAGAVLGREFDKILTGHRHDPSGRSRMAALTKEQKRQVYAKWLTELNADILGVSLAAEYMRDHGPYRGKPGIVGGTYMSVHLCFLAQMFLAVYAQLKDPHISMVSKGHPPIDFRAHNVLMWMYKDQMQEVTEPLVHYIQKIMKEVVSPSMSE